MKVEGRKSQKLAQIFLYCIGGIYIALAIGLSIGLSIAYSDWRMLMVLIILPFGAFFVYISYLVGGSIEIMVNHEGVSCSGFLLQRPHKIFWGEIEKADIDRRLTMESIMFSKKECVFEQKKGQVIIPVTPETLYVIAHYFPEISELFPKLAPYLNPNRNHSWSSWQPR
jgi:hypothetical protein